MSIQDTKPIKQKVIYVYNHPNYPKHNGWLKIGDQTGLDSTRIDDQNEADNVETNTLFQVPAVDVYGNTFRDYDIHRELEIRGFQREPKVNNSRRKSEWFKVDLETVKRIINDRIHCRDGFENKRPSGDSGQTKIVLRKEQNDAIDTTYAYWQNRAEFPDRNFLWNAKPRFGKTLTSYKFAERIEAKRVLIITNRPAISDSWARDFYDHIEQESPINYLFAASKSFFVNDRRVPSREDILNIHSDFVSNLSRPLIFFISLQDIKGKSADSDDFKKKNQWIFDIPGGWDLLIIDESHEGVQTSKTADVMKNLNVDFTLHLSGTPFKAIAGGKFTNDQIFNWSYSDEQEKKEDWDPENGDNPYEELPRMNFRAYHMSTMMESQVENEEACFDLGEFFKASGNGFIRPSDVEKWLDKISGIARNEETGEITVLPVDAKLNQPFDSEEKRDQLRHTFWFMSRINECKAMKELLNKHPIFKEYEVILAAGKGDDEQEGKRVLEKVQNAIGDDPTKTKTITLSCGQLTIGITVRPWTAVFMLYGTTGTGSIIKSSSTQYLQAAFRSQNPWSYGEHKEFYKTDCYVFDFAPDRVLTILQDYAVNLSGGGKKNEDHKPAIRKLLNYMSVISMDDKGELRELDAKDIVELPRRLIAKEIVDGGFVTSNKLFNIGNIFHASAEARAIINKLQAIKKQKLEKKSEDLPEPRTQVDENDEAIVDPEILVNTSNGVLKEKKYEELTTEEAQIAKEVAQNNAILDTTFLPDEIPEEKQELIKEAVEEIKETAKKKTEDRKKKEEDEYRDKLRGFARTIPMLLHAYGRNGITFDDLEKIIADDVFEQITGISKDEFRVLRKENYFNEDNCNVAIKEFMSREEALSNYFSIGVDADIFDYIPMQEQNRVFTPKKVVTKMLDMLEEENPEIFKSTKRKFLDPYSKSGLFLAGIVKRLFQNLRPRFNSDKECLIHILSNQIYAWSPNDPLRKSSINTVLGFMRFDRVNYEPKDKRSLEDNFLKYDPMNEKGEIDNDKVLEHTRKCWGEDMKFDVIIGNPPYQLNDNGKRVAGAGANASASPLYHKFINLARSLRPDYLSMIVPSRWMVSGKGLGAFREDLLADHRMRVLHDFPNDKEVFPNANIDIKGGVCYFLWDLRYSDKCKYYVHNEDGDSYLEKYLDEDGGVVIRYAELSSIKQKVWSHPSLTAAKDDQDDPKRLSAIISVGKPYGLRTDTISNPAKYGLPPMFDTPEEAIKDGKQPFEIYGLVKNKRVKKYLPYDYPITIGRVDIPKWKVFIPEAYGCGAIGEQIPSPILGSPIQICTETFLRYGSFDEKYEAENALKYLKTKFFRCLVGIYKNTQHTTKRVYVAVPVQDFTSNSDIDWAKEVSQIDKQLYKKYNLSQEEIDFIEDKVKEM